MGQLAGLRGIIVPPVEKTDVTKRVDAGTIATDGYACMALSSLNVVAIPLEIKAPAEAEPLPYLMAKLKRFDVGFPRYRVLLCNTTGASATWPFSSTGHTSPDTPLRFDFR